MARLPTVRGALPLRVDADAFAKMAQRWQTTDMTARNEVPGGPKLRHKQVTVPVSVLRYIVIERIGGSITRTTGEHGDENRSLLHAWVAREAHIDACDKSPPHCHCEEVAAHSADVSISLITKP